MVIGLSRFMKKTVEARDLLVSVCEQCFQNWNLVQGASIINARYDFSFKRNIPLAVIARFELGGAIAMLTNMFPTCFWMIYHAYSYPVILQSCRGELSPIMSGSSSLYGGRIYSINITERESSCPTPFANLQEMLRFRTVGTSARLVM
jgi:hypothetical protein